jgi:hypothetical protein
VNSISFLRVPGYICETLPAQGLGIFWQAGRQEMGCRWRWQSKACTGRVE